MLAIYSLIYLSVSVGFVFLFRSISTRLPLKLLFKVFFFGTISGPVAGFVSHLFKTSVLGPNYDDNFAISGLILYFFIVGPVEELVKFIAVFMAANRDINFRGSLPGMLLAVTAALGFAGGENILYMMAYGLENTLPRLILGNLGHAAFSVFWGYAYGAVLAENAEFRLLTSGLLLASVLHGLYNYLLIFSLPGAIAAFTFAAVLYLVLFFFFKNERSRS